MFSSYFRHPFPYLMAASLILLYFTLPSIGEWVAAKPTFSQYAYLDAGKTTISIQKKMLFPFGGLMSKAQRAYLAIPYFLVLCLLLRAVFIHTKKWWYYAARAFVIGLCVLFLFPGLMNVFENETSSKSIGHVANGRIENSKRMNFRGKNFTTYFFGGYLIGRTFVNDKVKKVILDAYEAVRERRSDITWVIGEIGHRKGGKFLPHRTHQNGLSVDFMSPLLKKGKAYRSNHVFNLWGYGHEFDNQGQDGNIVLDYEAIALHLFELDQAAKANGLVIQKVIFDPVLRPQLFKTKFGSKIKHLPYTKNRVIVRHDDHYHVDFGIPERRN